MRLRARAASVTATARYLLVSFSCHCAPAALLISPFPSRSPPTCLQPPGLPPRFTAPGTHTSACSGLTPRLPRPGHPTPHRSPPARVHGLASFSCHARVCRKRLSPALERKAQPSGKLEGRPQRFLQVEAPLSAGGAQPSEGAGLDLVGSLFSLVPQSFHTKPAFPAKCHLRPSVAVGRGRGQGPGERGWRRAETWGLL